MGFFNQIPGVKLVELDQRSALWHSWRNGDDLPDRKPRITGTTAAIIAGDSVRRVTPNQLFLEWSGRRPLPEPNEYLKKLWEHGQKLEPAARKAYIELTGNVVQDVCVQHPMHPWAGASLDGLTRSGDIITELKCPMSQRIHNMAKAGTVPSYYLWQCMWQLLTTPSAQELHYMSYFPNDEDKVKEGLVIVPRDRVKETWLLNMAVEFRNCLLTDRPPVSDDFLIAGKAYRAAKAEADDATAMLDAAKTTLLALMPEDRDTHEGGGVRVTRYFKDIKLDPAKVLERLNVDASQAQAAMDQAREPGPVNMDRAFEILGLDLLKVQQVTDEMRREQEDQLRTAGKVSSRITLSTTFDEDDLGSAANTMEEALAEQAQRAQEDEPPGKWTW